MSDEICALGKIQGRPISHLLQLLQTKSAQVFGRRHQRFSHRHEKILNAVHFPLACIIITQKLEQILQAAAEETWNEM